MDDRPSRIKANRKKIARRKKNLFAPQKNGRCAKLPRMNTGTHEIYRTLIRASTGRGCYVSKTDFTIKCGLVKRLLKLLFPSCLS